jgi:hypothetical protein
LSPLTSVGTTLFSRAYEADSTVQAQDFLAQAVVPDILPLDTGTAAIHSNSLRRLDVTHFQERLERSGSILVDFIDASIRALSNEETIIDTITAVLD